jgi:hypothetical protein
LPTGSMIDGFMPRALVGFQVKKSDISAGALEREMRPAGKLRPSRTTRARFRGLGNGR